MTRRFIAHQVRTAKAKPGPSEKRSDRAAARELATGARAGGKLHWPKEIGGPEGPEPTRYGDWERKGICSDF